MKIQSETNSNTFDFEQFIAAGNAVNNEKVNEIVNHSFESWAFNRRVLEENARARSDLYELVMSDYRSRDPSLYDVYAILYCCKYEIRMCYDITYFSIGDLDIYPRQVYITYKAVLSLLEKIKNEKWIVERNVEIFRFWFEKTYSRFNR